MFEATVQLLACPGFADRCGGALSLRCDLALPASQQNSGADVAVGLLTCGRCGAFFPVIAGVAVLLSDWPGYLQTRNELLLSLSAADFPTEVSLTNVKGRGSAHHSVTREWESKNVLQSYLLAHFLPFAEVGVDGPDELFVSRRIAALMRHYMTDHPHALLSELMGGRGGNILDIGCSVGGVIAALAAKSTAASMNSYLGLDISLRAISAARRLLSGATTSAVSGANLSQKDWLPAALRETLARCHIDFIISDAWSAPVAPRKWDLAVALNMVDFAPNPMSFLHHKAELIRSGGNCFSAAPLSRESTAVVALAATGKISDRLATDRLVSAYLRAGFSLCKRIDDMPWIMPRGPRCIEYFSVDALFLTLERLGSD